MGGAGGGGQGAGEEELDDIDFEDEEAAAQKINDQGKKGQEKVRFEV